MVFRVSISHLRGVHLPVFRARGLRSVVVSVVVFLSEEVLLESRVFYIDSQTIWPRTFSKSCLCDSVCSGKVRMAIQYGAVMVAS